MGLNRAYWTVDGVVFPRNPDNWSLKYGDSNVTYAPQASGNIRRVTVPFKIQSSPILMEWHYADWMTRSFVMQKLMNGDVLHTIEMAGEMPRKIIQAWFDTPNIGMTKEAFDTRLGQGNQRRDISLTGQTNDPYIKSFYNVPANTNVSPPTAAEMVTWFGGPMGTYRDYLPFWNGVAYNQILTGAKSITLTNMGNAPWSGIIRFNGPFNTGMQINVTYLDVDGTGDGVCFQYLGSTIPSGDYLYFDTRHMRLYSCISGAINEIFSFLVNAISSDTPYPYWPPAPVGNFVVDVAAISGTGADTSIDYSNNGAEWFRYWG